MERESSSLCPIPDRQKKRAEAETYVRSSSMALKPLGERVMGNFIMAGLDEQPRTYRLMWETTQQSQQPHRKDFCREVGLGKQAFQTSCSGLENQGNQGEEHHQEPFHQGTVWIFSQLLHQGRVETKSGGNCYTEQPNTRHSLGARWEPDSTNYF